MANTWFSCKGCSSSDPTQDTVKVELGHIIDKENVRPLQLTKQNEEDAIKLRKEEAAAAASREEAARREAEVAACHEAAERAKREAAEWAEREAVERAQREAEERAQHEAAERAREEEAAAAAAAAAAAEERLQQEAAEAHAATLARKEAEEKVAEWCKNKGFMHGMNAPKKTYKGHTKFPLHTAVKYDNHEMIGFMLVAGVKKDVKDSNNQTPSQLAAKLNKNGSRDQVLAMLC